MHFTHIIDLHKSEVNSSYINQGTVIQNTCNCKIHFRFLIIRFLNLMTNNVNKRLLSC